MRIAGTAACLVALLTITACGASTGSTVTSSGGAHSSSVTAQGAGEGGGIDTIGVNGVPSSSAAPGSSTAASKSTSAKGTSAATENAKSTGGRAASATPAKIPAGLSEVVRYAVPVAMYHDLVTQAMAAHYRPVSFDGYDVGGKTYFNVVFRPFDVPWYHYVEMSASGYQTRFDTFKSEGYHPTLVESYLNGGQIRYGAIWVKSSGPAYYAFHGYTASAYQSLLDQKTADGYVPVTVSAVSVNGVLSYAGLLTKRSMAGWLLKSQLTPSQYQTLFDSEKKAGLSPAYLNAYTVNGSVRFVALFTTSPSVPFQARHGLTAAGVASQVSAAEKAGYFTGSLAGYNDGGQAHFLGFWTKAH